MMARAQPRSAPAQAFTPPPETGRVRVRDDMFPSGPDPDAYAVVLDGHCMAPELNAGDMAICSPRAPVRAGDIVALWPANGGKPTLKRLVMAPMYPVGTPVHPDSEVIPVVIIEQLNPPRTGAIKLPALRAMHRVVGTYRETELAEALVLPA